jgi:hypothetical protein
MQVLGLLELTRFVVHGLCKFSDRDSLVGEGSGRQAAQGRMRSVFVVQPLSTRPIVPALATTVSSSTDGIREPGVRFAFTR